jgi:hypothetical protein
LVLLVRKAAANRAEIAAVASRVAMAAAIGKFLKVRFFP